MARVAAKLRSQGNSWDVVLLRQNFRTLPGFDSAETLDLSDFNPFDLSIVLLFKESLPTLLLNERFLALPMKQMEQTNNKIYMQKKKKKDK